MWIIRKDTEQRYRNLCQSFIDNETLFNSFKSNKMYRAIVGDSDTFEALHFYRTVKETPSVLSFMPEFAKTDYLGSPQPTPLKYSRDIMRYAQTVCYLEKYFGALDGKNVLEFGGGYGGLAACIMKRWSVAYNIVDLDEARNLAIKCLSREGLALTDFGDNIDLFVAEYSLTEMTPEALYGYYTKYIKPSKAVFLRCNLASRTERLFLENHLQEDFKTIISFDEKPETRKPNVVIIGKN
jgi:hypothetical protein